MVVMRVMLKMAQISTRGYRWNMMITIFIIIISIMIITIKRELTVFVDGIKTKCT